MGLLVLISEPDAFYCFCFETNSQEVFFAHFIYHTDFQLMSLRFILLH